MARKNKNHVYKVEKAGGLEGRFRKIFQNPNKILGNYIREGMTVLDLGCGPGFFSIEAARLVGSSGKVIASDLQEDMLSLLKEKIAGTEIERTIILHKSEKDRIGIEHKVDLLIAFYVVHELPDQKKFFEEAKQVLRPGGRLFIAEPRFIVTKKEFDSTVNAAFDNGFSEFRNPKITMSRAIILQK